MSFPENALEQNVPPASTEVAALKEKSREAILRELLPFDYDYASQSGLIDMFYRDENYDGLVHTLGGSVDSGGFHHEPSAAVIWPTEVVQEGEARPVTRVDRSHLDELRGEKRKVYMEYPFEPFAARVVIGGLTKYAMHTDPRTSEKILKPAKSSMYPNEYDALAVMQAVRIARDTRDETKDQESIADNGRPVKTAIGRVPLIDGKTYMNIRLILERGTDKVITAFPVLPRKPGIMKLKPEEARKHLFG